MKKLELWKKETEALGMDVDTALLKAIHQLSVSCQANCTRKNKEITELENKRKLLLDIQSDREAEELNEILKYKKEIMIQLKAIQLGSQLCHNSLDKCINLSQERLKHICEDLNVYKDYGTKGDIL